MINAIYRNNIEVTRSVGCMSIKRNEIIKITDNLAVYDRLIIIGAGGHALAVLDAVNSNYSIEIVFVGLPNEHLNNGNYEIIDNINDLVHRDNDVYFVAVGDNYKRQKIVKELIESNAKIKFATIVHASAYVSKLATIYPGSLVLGGAHVGPAAVLQRHSLLNSRCSIDHECVIEEFASIGPGAVLGGNVTVGARSVIAMSACVHQGVNCGEDTILGANSFANSDLGCSSIYYGTPAKLIKNRKG